MLRAGDKVIPGLTLETFLGSGEFGEVWKALAPGGAYIALKFVDLGVQQGQKEFRSVQRIKSIRHPNLVPTYGMWLLNVRMEVIEEVDFASVYDGDQPPVRGTLVGERHEPALGSAAKMLVIATALCDKNLWQCMHECRQRGLPGIPANELLNYLADAAKAIDFLNAPRHELNGTLSAVHHCDIKPANIMLVGDAAVVGDFGVARVLGIHGTARSTAIGGSVAYAAPEIFENRTHSTTDQYSLAISYYELRTGLLPFEESSVGQVIRTKSSGLLTFAAVSRAEQKVLKKATSVDPNKRYLSTTALIAELRKAQEQRRSWLPFIGIPSAIGLIAFVLLACLIYPQREAIKSWITSFRASAKSVELEAKDESKTPVTSNEQASDTKASPEVKEPDKTAVQEPEAASEPEAPKAAASTEQPSANDQAAIAGESEPALEETVPNESEIAIVTETAPVPDVTQEIPFVNESPAPDDQASNAVVEDQDMVLLPSQDAPNMIASASSANQIEERLNEAIEPTEPEPQTMQSVLQGKLSQASGVFTTEEFAELQTELLPRLEQGQLLDSLRPEGVSTGEASDGQPTVTLFDADQCAIVRAFENRVQVQPLATSDSVKWFDTPCSSPIRELAKLPNGLLAIDAENQFWFLPITIDQELTDVSEQSHTIDVPNDSQLVMSASQSNPILVVKSDELKLGYPHSIMRVGDGGELTRLFEKEPFASSQQQLSAHCDESGSSMLLWEDGAASKRLMKLLKLDEDKTIDLSKTLLGKLASIRDVLFLRDRNTVLINGQDSELGENKTNICNYESKPDVRLMDSEFGASGPVKSDGNGGYLTTRPNVLTQCIRPRSRWIERDISYYDAQDNVHPIERAELATLAIAPNRWLLHVTTDAKLIAAKLYDEDQTGDLTAPDGFELKWVPPQAQARELKVVSNKLVVIDNTGSFTWYDLNEAVVAAELRLNAGKTVQ